LLIFSKEKDLKHSFIKENSWNEFHLFIFDIS
jgi:hypothetical protein